MAVRDEKTLTTGEVVRLAFYEDYWGIEDVASGDIVTFSGLGSRSSHRVAADAFDRLTDYKSLKRLFGWPSR